MAAINLLLGDCGEVLKTLQENSVDSIICDPPYGLSFMGKKWDYDVPSKEVWKECLRVLKPGGYLLAFAGTRTQHRMAVNIEDAGFEIRDMIAWVYGSGFPKSLNIGKAVDKRGSKSVGWFGKWLREWREKENWKEATNFHSTVKPLSLMEYLVKLVSREGQVVLDPFMGSGTTGMACKKLNRDFIGIEMMPEYMEIAKCRIRGVEKESQLNML